MNIREYLNQNPAVVTIGAIVLLIVCLGLIVTQLTGSGGGPGNRALWYYDLQAGEVFKGSTTDVPPISAPSGGEGVRTYLFACGSCEELKGKIKPGMNQAELLELGVHVGYFESYTPEVKSKRESAATSDDPEAFAQIESLPSIVAVPNDGGDLNWVEISPYNPMGPQMERLESMCSGERYYLCLPK